MEWIILEEKLAINSELHVLLLYVPYTGTLDVEFVFSNIQINFAHR